MTILDTHYELDDLGNGRYRHTQYIRPIAYLSSGVMRRITNKLGDSGDPNLSIGVDELVQFRLRSKLAGNSPVWHFGKGTSMVRMTPLGTANVQGVAVGESGWLYPEAWVGADLRLTIAGHRLQKDVILRAGHPSQFQFRIDEQAGLNIDTLETADFRILAPVLFGPNGESVPLTWAKATQGGKLILTVNLPAGNYAGWVLDPTITLQPDGTDGIDTYINADSPTTNYGANNVFWVGQPSTNVWITRTLIKFNLATLPAGAIISSAVLSLYLGSEASTNDRALRVYRQSRSWVEDQATWNVYSTGNNWQTAGGFGLLDCEQTAIGTRNFLAAEAAGAFKDWTLSATTKSALDAGNGWLIKADTEEDDGYRFNSSDNATAASRPKLVIVYTPSLAGHNVGAGIGQGVLSGVC